MQASYGNQALILKAWGRLDEAFELHKKKEAICLELGNQESLATSLINQAHLVAFSRHQPAEALPLAERALDIANRHGMIALRNQIEPILNRIRALLG